MAVDQKIATVQGIYEAFGRGDVASILDVVTDDVDWASEPDNTIGAPWQGLRKGKGEVPSFFQAIGENVDVTQFDVVSIASNDTDVFAVVRFGMKVKATGKQGEMDLHHWFSFRDGKVCKYRGTEDTALTAQLLGS